MPLLSPLLASTREGMRKRIPTPSEALSHAVGKLPGDLKSARGSAKSSARLTAMGSLANTTVAAAAGNETLALLSLGIAATADAFGAADDPPRGRNWEGKGEKRARRMGKKG